MEKRLEESRKRYPYYIYPAIEAVKTAGGEDRRELVRWISTAIGDERVLREVLGLDPEEFRQFYPDMAEPELSTDETITSFIDRFSTEQAAETPEVEELVTAPAIDYASLMLDDEGDDEMPQDSTSDAIADFLNAVPAKKPAKREEKQPIQKTEERTELSEELFKMMVKNGNYGKALEIITEISLKNPKKSIYFADQIRFLKKLIEIKGEKVG